MKKKLLVISIITSCIAVHGEINRIQSLRFDRSKTETIYLTPGLGSIVLFPCSLVEVFVARSEDLKVQISPSDRKSIFLNLKKTMSQPTNIICRCEDNRTVFVFDVVPSKQRHQDVVELRSIYGKPDYKTTGELTKVENPQSFKKVIVLKSPAVVEEGKTK